MSFGWVPQKDTTSLLLQRLGFPDDSVFPVIRAAERLLVAAKIDGENAIVTLDTGLRLDVYLDRSYVERRGFAIEWRGDQFGVCPTGDFVMLGRQRVFNTATVQALPAEKGQDPAYAGTLGTMFFNDGLLGIDQASGEIARTSHYAAVRALLPDPTHRLDLLPNVQDGDCFDTSDANPGRFDCAEPRRAAIRIVHVVDGVADGGRCDQEALVFTVPDRTICYQPLQFGTGSSDHQS